MKNIHSFYLGIKSSNKGLVIDKLKSTVQICCLVRTRSRGQWTKLCPLWASNAACSCLAILNLLSLQQLIACSSKKCNKIEGLRYCWCPFINMAFLSGCITILNIKLIMFKNRKWHLQLIIWWFGELWHTKGGQTEMMIEIVIGIWSLVKRVMWLFNNQ